MQHVQYMLLPTYTIYVLHTVASDILHYSLFISIQYPIIRSIVGIDHNIGKDIDLIFYFSKIFTFYNAYVSIVELYKYNSIINQLIRTVLN